MSKLDIIFKGLFNQVYNLENWINQSGNDILPELVKSDDPKSYKRLLKTTRICMSTTDTRTKRFPTCFSPTQNFHQIEIILRVIERILKKDEKSNNVLVLGFSLKSQNPDARISRISNIENRYPNSNVNRLQYSSWELLLSRIGDVMMSYILEYTSIFIQIGESSCCIQLTGEGIQDLVLRLKNKTLPVVTRQTFHNGDCLIDRRYKNKLKKRKNKRRNKNNFTKLKSIAKDFISTNTHNCTRQNDHDRVTMETDMDSSQKCKLKLTKKDALKTSASIFGSEDDSVTMVTGMDSSQKWDLKQIKEGISETSGFVFGSEDDRVTMVTGMDSSQKCNLKRTEEDAFKSSASIFGSEDGRIAMVTGMDSSQKCDLKHTEEGTPESSASIFGSEDGRNTKITGMYSSQKCELKMTEEGTPETSASIFGSEDDRVTNVTGMDSSQKCELKMTEEGTPETSASIFGSEDNRVTNVTGMDSSQKCELKMTEEGTPETSASIFGSEDDRVTNVTGMDSSQKCELKMIEESTPETSSSIFGSEDDKNNFKTKIDNSNETITIPQQCDTPLVFKTKNNSPVFSTTDIVNTVSSNEEGCFSGRRLITCQSIEKIFSSQEKLDPNASNRPAAGVRNSTKRKGDEIITANKRQKFNKIFSQNMPKNLDDAVIMSNNQISSNWTQMSGDIPQEVTLCDDQNVKCDRKLSSNKRRFSEMKYGNKLECCKNKESKKQKVCLADVADSDKEITREMHQSSTVGEKDVKPFNCHQLIRRVEFYGKNLRERIPKLDDDLYNKIKTKDVGGSVLLNVINNQDLPLVPLLNNLTTKYKKFPWFSMLKYYCPTSSTKKNKNKRRKKPCDTGKLLESFTSHNQIYVFLKVVITRVIPEELFGCHGNRNIFLRNVKKLVNLGKFDRIYLGEIMTNIKVKSCKWLKGVFNPTLKSCLMAKLYLWLMEDFTCNILKSFFCITDSGNYRNRVFYYRKAIWQTLFFRSFNIFKEKSCLKLISMKEVEELLRAEKALGVGHLRFLPKTSSCRPIINLGKNLQFPGINKTIPINKQLLNLLHVLTTYKDKNSDVLGSSVFGSDDVYQRLKHFIQKRKTDGDKRELYFVKTDIINCFDTIKPDKMFQIIQNILLKNKEDFITRRYFTVMAAGNKLCRLFHRDSQSLSDYNPDFFSFVADKVNNCGLKNVILVDKVVNDHDSVVYLLQQLYALLFYNIIKVGKRYYKQEIGISQGSVLSTLLSNYYYADMEKSLISALPDELLMRMVDDYLYITPHKHRAVEFLLNIWKGNEEYNCFVNPDKIVTNFACSMETRDIQPFPNKEFSWCGFLIDTKTLNVSVDYNRSLHLDISDMVTFNLGQNPGAAMKNKIMLSIRPKCHSLLLDPVINSEGTILVNISSLFQLTALKFICYHKRLPVKQRSSNNTQYFIDMILGFASYMYQQAMIKLGKLNREEIDLSVSPADVKWICVYSFIKQLTIYHSQFYLLLKCLKVKMKQFGKKVGGAKVTSIKKMIDECPFLAPQANF